MQLTTKLTTKLTTPRPGYPRRTCGADRPGLAGPHPGVPDQPPDRGGHASFQLTGRPLSVQLVNVHLFYGSEQRADIERRALETAAVAKGPTTATGRGSWGPATVTALGDFNMPKPKKQGGNIVYDALTRAGLVTPPHSTEIGSSIASDNQYDQIALFPETTKKWLVDIGVFDYPSDHRPMWVQLRPT